MNNPNNLKLTNAHPRDADIKFWEEGHRYEILTDPGTSYKSVTTWVHSHFPKFNADNVIRKMKAGKNWNESNKYWGMTAGQIKKQWNESGRAAASAGTQLHEQIECFMNNNALQSRYTHAHLIENINNENINNENISSNSNTDTDEWSYFLQFIRDTPTLCPYRTEWTIYHEDAKFAGTIDMVYENSDGTLSIYDWKRCKEITKANNFGENALTKSILHLPATNYWQYSLQLNTYRKILEDKYGKKVSELYLVKFHPDDGNKTYELIKVPLLDDEMKELFAPLTHTVKNTTINAVSPVHTPTNFEDFVAKFNELSRRVEELVEKVDSQKGEILNLRKIIEEHKLGSIQKSDI